MDFATSSDPAVQAQLDRLTMLSPGADVLGLSRITALLARLGDPHRRLPPVFHVAGTNGKGSTCAFLRAALEAEGYRVHAYTSPHLVHFNERIRVAGRLIEDAVLAPLLERVLDAGGDLGASFFEVTTAAAFLIFAETPADAAVVEVGLGGRLDATNVVADPAVCGIVQLGIDHQAFLGDTIAAIAAEKAGIAKPGRPLVVMDYDPPAMVVVTDTAERAGAPLLKAGRDWHFAVEDGRLHYRDLAGQLTAPLPTLAGAHQVANLALAIAMLRLQDILPVSLAALQAAPTGACWPARMQRLKAGPLTELLPADAPLWLDGGHNVAAAGAIAAALRDEAGGQPIAIILGMLANKDVEGFLDAFGDLAASITAVPITGHAHHAPERIVAHARARGMHATTAPDVPSALGQLAGNMPWAVAILGSLYLAGEVLAANGEPPE